MKKCIGLIAGCLPILASAQLIMTNAYYLVLNGGTQANPTKIILTNGAPSGLRNIGTGWIISESEFNMVQWNIGTNTGTYKVRFGYGTSDSLPVTCDIATAGVGSGDILFSTYHAPSWNNSPYPSDVKNMVDFSNSDSIGAVDRFWILDAEHYTTKPTPDSILFTYIRSGASSEISSPNYIIEDSLVAQRFNSVSNEWYDWIGKRHTDNPFTNTGTVSSGLIAPTEFYRSWCLFNDSTIQVTTGSYSIEYLSKINIFPNPSKGDLTVTGLKEGKMVELYNYIGQKLNSLIAHDAVVHFDISTIADGMYIVKIQNIDGSIAAQKKVVKME